LVEIKDITLLMKEYSQFKGNIKPQSLWVTTIILQVTSGMLHSMQM